MAKYLFIDTNDALKKTMMCVLSCNENDLSFIETENKKYTEILNEINSIDEIKEIILCAELDMFEDKRETSPGLEILKNIRLSRDLGERQFCMITILHWFTINHYISQKPDSLILFAPNTFRIYLPALNLLKQDRSAEAFESFEKFVPFLKPFVIFEKSDEQRSIHDFRNEYGPKILKNQIEKHSKSSQDKKYSIADEPLWIKKFFLLHNQTAQHSISSEFINYTKKVFKLFRLPTNDNPLKVLWVDDEIVKWEKEFKAVIGISLKEMNSRLSAAVVELIDISTFNEARKYVKNIHNKYDLVILDLRIDKENDKWVKNNSDYSGIQLIRSVRSAKPDIPVIIFTASLKASNMKAALNAGADAFLTKGTSSLEELLFTLKKELCISQMQNTVSEINKYYLFSPHTGKAKEASSNLRKKIRIDLISCITAVAGLVHSTHSRERKYYFSNVLSIISRLIDIKYCIDLTPIGKMNKSKINQKKFNHYNQIWSIKRLRNSYTHGSLTLMNNKEKMIDMSLEGLNFIINQFEKNTL